MDGAQTHRAQTYLNARNVLPLGPPDVLHAGLIQQGDVHGVCGPHERPDGLVRLLRPLQAGHVLRVPLKDGGGDALHEVRVEGVALGVDAGHQPADEVPRNQPDLKLGPPGEQGSDGAGPAVRPAALPAHVHDGWRVAAGLPVAVLKAVLHVLQAMTLRRSPDADQDLPQLVPHAGHPPRRPRVGASQLLGDLRRHSPIKNRGSLDLSESQVRSVFQLTFLAESIFRMEPKMDEPAAPPPWSTPPWRIWRAAISW